MDHIPYQHDYMVVDGDAVAGVVSLGLLRYLHEGTWARTTLGEVMRREAPVAQPDEHIADVLQRMTEYYLTAIPVIDGKSGRFLGAVTSQDIVGLVLSKGRQ